jgi:hypothetical protein
MAMAAIDGARPVALVTGASSGIGRELARILAREGHDLALVARSEERLVELAGELEKRHGIRVRTLAADLSDPGAPAALAAQLEHDRVSIDILVNNAGFGASGPFWETDARLELDLIQVNVTALTHLTRLLLPEMLRRHSGRILNVASTAAFQPGPFMAVYYASKAFVLSFSEALASELSGTGVAVTALCPGPTDTGFQERAGVARSNLFRRFRVLSAEAVAAAGYAGMRAGRRVVVPGLQNRLLAVVVRLAPGSLVLRVMRFLHSRSGR